MSDVVINSVNGVDIVQFQPEGVCSKMMKFRIKDDVILDVEFIGGCAGNLGGIGMLVKGMNVHEVIKKLQGLPCGARKTSCPDQLTKGLSAYINSKQTVKAS